MKDGRFLLMFIMLLIVETVLAKYCQIGPYIYISLLPAMILCLPTTSDGIRIMLEAFACGLLVDFLADGVPGLNACAAVPLAAMQKSILRLMIDEELVTRGYSFTYRRYGVVKIGAALLLMSVVYFTIYCIFDNAGERPFGFILLKILLSTLFSLPFGLVVCNILPSSKSASL